MRKATVTLLAAAFVVAAAGGAWAKSAGVGLEWGWVPTVPFNGFGVKTSNQEFTLAWELSDSFEVGVFRGAGQFGGESSYTDDTGAVNIERRLKCSGTTAVSGIRLLAGIPALSMLKAGLELGVMSFAVNPVTLGYTYTDSDGSGTTNAANFYPGAVAPNPTETAPLIGLAAKATLISAETNTVKSAVTVTGALRFVDTTDAYLLGQQEVSTVKAVAGNADEIDEVGNFTNLAIGINLGLWF
jgi:hypothetical protein